MFSEQMDIQREEVGVFPMDISENHSFMHQMEFDMDWELALGEKSKRCRYELEIDEKQQLPLAKKFKQSIILQPAVPSGLELDMDIDETQVGGSHDELLNVN